jgi:hypothetical protein
MLSLTLFCSKILSQETPKIEDLQCLSRPLRDAFTICLEENRECHRSLRKAETSDSSDWSFFIGTFLLGAATGLVISHQIPH